jgi:light-regulated signal transduction histidine kinase (bacteriophytochrome)
MLRELLNNLLDNALRYTPAGSCVTVRVCAEPASHCVLLEVEDTGPGIPKAGRGHVFERFFRLLGSPAEDSGLAWRSCAKWRCSTRRKSTSATIRAAADPAFQARCFA